MAAPEYSIDYYILSDDGETLIDARGAQIFAVASKTDFEEVEELVAFHYDDLISASLLPTLKFLPEPSSKPVNMGNLLANLANDHSLTIEERRALLELRDSL